MGTIGERLKIFRVKKDMTLDDVAKFLDVSRQTIQRYESGVIPNIPLSKVSKLAKLFNTTTDYLIDGKEIIFTDKIDDISASSDTGIELTESEREMIEQFRQLSDRDKGKIEGRIEEMLKDDYKSGIKDA